MPEMAQLLGTTRSSVYTILDNPKYSHFFEFIVIAEKKRITKESFQKFLEGQDRYKLDPLNDYEELAQEQNIALANFRRKKLSQTGIRGSNGNIKYLTFDEASYLAKVSRSMINKWADKGKFTVIKVGSRVRIRRDEFEDWMEQVQRYISLTKLIPEMLQKLDDEIISFCLAVEIAALSEKEQRELLVAMEYAQAIPSLSQAQRIRQLSKEKQLSLEKMEEIMCEVKKGEITRVAFTNEQLHKYFPNSYTPAMMKREILALLKLWKKESWES